MIHFRSLLLFFISAQFLFSQEIKSKKEINTMLTQAGQAFFDLESKKSLLFCKQALNDSYRIKDDNLMAKTYNIIGLNYSEISSSSSAIIFYKKALDHANSAQNDSIKLWVNNNLGSIYSYTNNDHNKGIYFYQEALTYAYKIKDSTEIIFTNLNICTSYFAVKDYKTGLKFLEKSNLFVKKSNNLEAKILVFSLYGNYFSSLNQNQEAEFFYKQAVALGENSKISIVSTNLIEVYKNFSEFYSDINKPNESAYYLDLHQKLKDKIYNEEKKIEVAEIISEIELEEYKRQIDRVETENLSQSKTLKTSKIIGVLSVVIFVVLLLLLLSLLKNNKLRDKKNAELKLANQELQIAKEAADRASLLKSQFVSTITHELRTPLYGVVGITNIIIDEHKELANSPHLNSLKFSAGYLLSLVNDLLQINKIEENRVILEAMIFNIGDEIRTIVDSLQFIAKKNNNKLVIQIDEKIPESLIGDKLRLSQVFMNLISNALKFTKNGEVKIIAELVKSEGSKNYLKFQIVDTGVGIAKEDQDKVFDKFVQIERKEGDYQGTGLGLAIVKKLVEIFGGTIQLESEEGKGTNFYFTIGFESDEKMKTEIINNIVVDLSTSYSYNVLVVEDNKINQIVTKKTLEKNSFICTVCDDGYAALELLADQKFDIILMDINMPIINGFETSKLIRKKGITTPIIALTAFDKQEVSEQVLASGMNDIIIKPFEQYKLFQAIAGLIENKDNLIN